jgi:uncharacterized membrane-anchored protein
MNTQSEIKLRRIERASTLLRAVCTGLIGFFGLVVVVGAVAMVAGRITSINYNSQSFALAGRGLGSRLILAATCVATVCVILMALYHLRRLLDNYSRREIFTTSSARQIRQFGISCILWGAIKIIWAFLPLVLATNPPHSFSLTLDSMIIGAVIIGISWFTEMATELREENELTI